MIDPTMHGLAWRLSHQTEKDRREAEHSLGRLAARLRRWRPKNADARLRGWRSTNR